MEFLRVNPAEDLLRATASLDTYEMVISGKYDICMIAGMEEGSLICYAIFSHIHYRTNDTYLEYLYTIPKRREEGACKELLDYCSEYLAAMGVKLVLSRMFIHPEHALEYNEFMLKKGFFPLSLTGRILEYNLSDMLDAGAIQTIIKNKKKLPTVVAPQNANEKYINALLSRQNETGFFFFKDECEALYSRFYQEAEEIHGAIIASRPSQDTLYISALYMDRVCEKKNMFLVLFCECLEPILAEVAEKDIRVIITLNRESIYNGLMKIFNPPEEEYIVLEHMRMTGRKAKGTAAE